MASSPDARSARNPDEGNASTSFTDSPTVLPLSNAYTTHCVLLLGGVDGPMMGGKQEFGFEDSAVRIKGSKRR